MDGIFCSKINGFKLLYSSSEKLVANSSLNGLKIGDGKKGKIFKKLLDLWSKNVKMDIELQIKNWNKKDNKNVSGATPYSFKK